MGLQPSGPNNLVAVILDEVDDRYRIGESWGGSGELETFSQR
jgi:hypothetical protein